MTYENAPATKMLASNCACCGRPLLDAESVEAGMGPVCRRSHGYARAEAEPNWEAVLAATDGLVSVASLLGPAFAGAGAPVAVRAMESAWRLGGLETRRVANLLVHEIACVQHGEVANALTNAVRALGFVRLADRIAARLAPIAIEVDGGHLVVKTPFIEGPSATAALRHGTTGAFWDRQAKRAVFPATAKRALFEALKKDYAGMTARGPKGLFTI